MAPIKRPSKNAPPAPGNEGIMVGGFPNLMTPDPILDSGTSRLFPARPGQGRRHRFKVTVRNERPVFAAERQYRAKLEGTKVDDMPTPASEWDHIAETSDAQPNKALVAPNTPNLPFSRVLMSRVVTQQTGKGKIARQAVLVCIGNGDGLVGYGEGKDGEWQRALEKANIEALRALDRVERFEQRTLFTELKTKLGSTKVILRPRPVGFGLRCNPNIHPILKAAGIKDCSAKVWGSRNQMNVIKATFRLLQAGHAPVGMGNGFGGPARTLDRGSGVRTKEDVERERGRRLIDLRT